MKKVLKLKKVHPKKAFRLGKHVVTHIAQEFDLSKDEVKELESKGCKHWICEAKLAPKKKVVKEEK